MAEAVIKSFKSKKSWRNWLDKNQDLQEGIWLQVFKVSSGVESEVKGIKDRQKMIDFVKEANEIK